MTGYGKRMAALLAAWLALAALAGCARRDPAGGARKDTDSGHVSAGDATGAPEPGKGIGGGDGDLRTYYEERIEEMKQTLLNERQERYISEYEYRERLAKLEQELRLLTAGAELDTAKQVAGQPETGHRREPGSLLPRPTPEPVVRPTPLPSDSFRYSIQDGQATVTGYLGGAGTVAVPAELGGCPVVAIGDGAFRGAGITAVILPDTVETVGWFAFADCTELASVTVPASVRSISYAAFENCTKLTVLCGRDSYAAHWAASYGLPVQYI